MSQILIFNCIFLFWHIAQNYIIVANKYGLDLGYLRLPLVSTQVSMTYQLTVTTVTCALLCQALRTLSQLYTTGNDISI